MSTAQTSGSTLAAPKKASPVRLILTLGLAGLFSGLITVLVYEWTLPRIEAHRAEALRQAVFEVVPGAERLLALFRDSEGEWRAEEPSAGSGPAPDLFAAYDQSGAFVGFALRGQGGGFQDVIRLLYGFDPEGMKLTGMRVLESRETPGLGDKIYKDAEFVAQWDDVRVEPELELTKEASVTGENIIHAITGATISSRALVRIVNETNSTWISELPDPSTLKVEAVGG